MPISPISFPIPSVPGVEGINPSAVASPAPTSPVDGGFAEVLTNSVDRLQGLQSTSDTLATKAATGDLKDAHDYMIASTEAALATEMVVTVRNKAVEAFSEIMRMPV